MMDFMRAGGVPMWIILLFGLIALVTAALFIWRPKQSKVPVIRSFSLATLFAVLSGITADLGAVFHNVPNNPEWAHSPDLNLIIMTGLGESMAPAILGFTILSLVWMLTGIGHRRLATRVV